MSTAAVPALTPVQAARLRTPTGFARRMLGHDIWHMQSQILESIAVNRRTAVKSCNASGKTFVSADAVLWWITKYRDGIAVTTAPTWVQVEKLLWGEIRKSAILSAQTGGIQFPLPNATELKLAEGNYAIGLSTNISARFQGFHSGRVLIVLDEAPGVRQEVWDAIQGLRAGGDVSLLAIGNPVELGGPFYDAFGSNRHMWNTFTINAFDTPNLRRTSLTFRDEEGNHVTIGYGRDLLEMTPEELDDNTRPYLCTRRWVREMYEEWGPTHPFFQSRVLGEFPTQGSDALIPLAWLERAKTREEEIIAALTALRGKADCPRPRAGLDVAGPGEDNTVLKVFVGPRQVLSRSWPQEDPRGEVVVALRPFKDDLEQFNIDSIGVGWGIYLHMKDIFGADVVKPINVGEAARDTEKFKNSKAEYYWGLRLRAQAGDLVGLDEKTIGQLAAIKYTHNSRGQIEIESKDDMKARGMKSPDFAEATMLAKADAPRIGMFDYYRDEAKRSEQEQIEQQRTVLPGIAPGVQRAPGPSPWDALR